MIPAILEQIYCKGIRDTQAWRELVDPSSNYLKRILRVLLLGKSLLCSCRPHYTWLDKQGWTTRGLVPFIQFENATAHMQLYVAEQNTITPDEYESLSIIKRFR